MLTSQPTLSNSRYCGVDEEGNWDTSLEAEMGAIKG